MKQCSVCKLCLKNFEYDPSQSKGVYCSAKCNKDSHSSGKKSVFCKACNKEFTVSFYQFNKGQGKHCSVECRFSLSKIEKNCIKCGSVFYTKKSKNNKFCSIECYRPTLEILDKVCEFCNISFKTKRSDAKFCSHNCFSKSEKTIEKSKLSCHTCGNEFFIETYLAKRKTKCGFRFCSPGCASVHSNKNRFDKRFFKCENCGKEEIVNKTSSKKKYCSKSCYFIKENDRIVARAEKLKNKNNRFITGVYFSSKTQKEYYYRSSWEMKYMQYLDNNNEVTSYTYESVKLSYIYRKHKRWYLPDFIIDGKVMVEIKPRYQISKKRNVAKFAAAREYCKQNNLDFKVMTEIELKAVGVQL